ncbi:LOW QUALITY PROTEIN: adhesion G protein-coupled receptor G3-like [Eudromia elegans]
MVRLLLSRVLLLLPLCDAANGQEGCDGEWLLHPLLQSARFSSREVAGVKALRVNISRAIPHDVFFSFSSLEGPKSINSTEAGNTSKIGLPRKLFQPTGSERACVVVAVLDITQLAVFQTNTEGMRCLQQPATRTWVWPLWAPPSVNPQGVFWDPGEGQGGGWNTRGCVTELGDKGTICSCDHLTFFTLLLVTTSFYRAPAFTLLVAACFPLAVRCTYKKLKSKETIQINLALHMNLGSSLFLLNLIFLFNNMSSVSQPGQCKCLGDLIHYCLLCCFTWMAPEGCHLSLLFVKVLGTYIRHYLLKLCAVGWALLSLLGYCCLWVSVLLATGATMPFSEDVWDHIGLSAVQEGFVCLPALVVTGTGSIGSYGEYNIQNKHHQPVLSLCWIKSEHITVHYITHCGYFGLIFLFNTVIFGVVAWKNYHLQSTRAAKEKRKSWKVGLVAVGLFCLLGATWALAFLTRGNASVPMLYLFAILNSLQGLFIFIWLVVLYCPKKEEMAGSSSNTIRIDKTPTVSQD